jgi:thiol-disulfide isomerase/thioredoxin
MKRNLFSALLAVLAIGLLAHADDKSAEKPGKSRAEQFADLQQEFRKLAPDVVREWKAANDDDGRNKALAKVDPLLEKAYKLVGESPTDDISLNTLLFAMTMKPKPPEKVIKLIIEHHINNPLLAEHMLQHLASNPEAGKITAAAEKSKSKEVRGAIMLANAQQKAETLEDAGAEPDQESRDKAVAALETVRKEFGDTKVGGKTLGATAEKSLYPLRHLLVGMKAPEVVSKDLDGKETKLSALKGKVVVLDIWTTWCGPCRAMIPHEREMVEKLKDKPFVLISVSGDEELETLKKFLTKEKMPWTHWWDGQRDTGLIHDWNVRYYPTLYVIDAKGVIRHKHIRGKELEDAVEKLIQEAEKKP